MGGQAFASRSPSLLTPRMPLQIYRHVLNNAQGILCEHYKHVAAPIEAPGKTSFGDVDVLVAIPRNADLDPNLRTTTEIANNLARVLNAKDLVFQKGNPTINLALPWPSLEPVETPPGTQEDYVQLDVHVCLSENNHVWALFMAAHGDLWNILGSTIRSFGLTVNDTGMYIRIPEIELVDRKKSRIFLTSDPSEVLSFLGLDETKWWKEFKSTQEMFEYAADCRFFRVKKEDAEEGVAVGDVIGEVEGQEGGEMGKKRLKHNDRQRMLKRPIFKDWIEDFIPNCRKEGRYLSKTASREQVREEACERYGIREKYETCLLEYQRSIQRDTIWRSVIKGHVPVENAGPLERAAAIRTLKSVILKGGLFDGEVVEASRTDQNGFYDLDLVQHFVNDNWRRAAEIGFEANAKPIRKVVENTAEEQALEKAEKTAMNSS